MKKGSECMKQKTTENINTYNTDTADISAELIEQKISEQTDPILSRILHHFCSISSRLEVLRKVKYTAVKLLIFHVEYSYVSIT